MTNDQLIFDKIYQLIIGYLDEREKRIKNDYILKSEQNRFLNYIGIDELKNNLRIILNQNKWT